MRAYGGDEGARTPDLDSAIVALSQLSYIPVSDVDNNTYGSSCKALARVRQYSQGFALHNNMMGWAKFLRVRSTLKNFAHLIHLFGCPQAGASG